MFGVMPSLHQRNPDLVVLFNTNYMCNYFMLLSYLIKYFNKFYFVDFLV